MSTISFEPLRLDNYKKSEKAGDLRYVLQILFFFYNVQYMLLLTLFHLWSTCIYHKADMPFPYDYLTFYLMFYMCLPQGQHIPLSIKTSS